MPLLVVAMRSESPGVGNDGVLTLNYLIYKNKQSSYFERLWCNYELAVHAKTCHTIGPNMDAFVDVVLVLHSFFDKLSGCHAALSPVGSGVSNVSLSL